MPATLNLSDAHTDAHTRRTLSDLSLSVAKCRRIVVVTGAGISCSCGIPDFRSSDGLYNLVKQQYPDVVLKGRDLFDASLFRDSMSTAVFYTFISQLKRSIDSAAPTPTHHFIKTLDTKGKLLRSYTQNIDGLEERIGLVGSSSQEAKATGKTKTKLKTKEVKNVQLHGDIHRVRCTFCSADAPCTEEYLCMFNAGIPPQCPECLERSEARVSRNARALKVGTLRPAIVLYDEPHPLGDEIGAIQTADIGRKPDMLIVMGTSLKVHGLKKLVKDFARIVHGSSPPEGDATKPSKPWTGKVVFVNRTPPGNEWADIFDYHVAGDTDSWTNKVIDDWKKLRPADWQVQQTLDEADASFKVVKPSKAKGDNKKRVPFAPGSENMPPPLDVVPIVKAKATKPRHVPSSPSKRQRVVSHYSDVESSPSKRNCAASKPASTVVFKERGMLFSNTPNVACMDISIGDADMKGACPPAKATARGRKARVPKIMKTGGGDAVTWVRCVDASRERSDVVYVQA